MDNLTQVPEFTGSMLREIAANMKEVSYRRLESANYYDLLLHDFNDGTAPLLKHGVEETDISHSGDKYFSKEKVSSVTESKANNATEVVKIEKEPPTLENVDCGPSQDTLVEVNEVSKQTSKKKKNKKNAKANDPQEERKSLIPNIVTVECSSSSSAQVHRAERSDQDQTVLSFPDAPAEADWI